MVGSDRRFVAVNPAFQKMTGYSEAELRLLSPVDITHDDDQSAAEAIVATSAAAQSYEKRYRRKDGGVIWAAIARTRTGLGGPSNRSRKSARENSGQWRMAVRDWGPKSAFRGGKFGVALSRRRQSPRKPRGSLRPRRARIAGTAWHSVWPRAKRGPRRSRTFRRRGRLEESRARPLDVQSPDRIG